MIHSGPATERVWRDFRARLRRFIARRVQNPDDAEDLLQEVFCKVHAKLGGLRRPDQLSSWLYRIAANTVTDYYRSRGMAAERLREHPLQSERAVPPDALKEMTACLAPMIRALPEPYRQTILLLQEEGLTQAAIGKKLGLSVAGAKSRVQRARKMLRETILDCCHLEFDRLGNILDYTPRSKACRFCA